VEDLQRLHHQQSQTLGVRALQTWGHVHRRQGEDAVESVHHDGEEMVEAQSLVRYGEVVVVVVVPRHPLHDVEEGRGAGVWVLYGVDQDGVSLEDNGRTVA